ncbi:MAG: hypothetical protein JNL60_13775 [Bacteroidia bacterium]|nr:hypothetical protein [Bacteroidia bacterium]
MKSDKKEDLPLVNIERNPLFLLVSSLLTGVIVFYAYSLLKAVNPWGFMVMVPAAVLAFQTLWWLLNPFAEIYHDRIEIKQSLFQDKVRYFVDLKKINSTKKQSLYITYNDDEQEELNLFGIKSSHLPLMKSEMEKFVLESMNARP